ncbi:Hypothetical predicted protein [Cloeon dipterum]|uniref:MRG domain-containing protein n=1 Tax=Cloeon dipterum TaxID=197152 RepID=A0A8S1DX81_9INSE|nr:Hypothetical predicted protein [Cloeon dipterum]
MSKNKENRDDAKEIKWDVHSNEVCLMKAIMMFRPVGLFKNFKMALIVEFLASKLDKPINSESIWKHLETLYNLLSLDEMEPPSEFNEEEFCLPSDFAALMLLKEQSTPVEKKAKSKVAKEALKRDQLSKEAVVIVRKEVIKTARESPKTQAKAVVKTPQPQAAVVETIKGAKAKAGSTPKTRDSAKKSEVAVKEKREPRELKNLGTPEVKSQPSRSKETRSSGVKSTKEESPIPSNLKISFQRAFLKVKI